MGRRSRQLRFVFPMLAFLLLLPLASGCSLRFQDVEDALSRAGAESQGSPFQPLSKQETMPGMVKALENEYLVLHVNPLTAEIALEDKRSGEVWMSNPPNRDEDGGANATNKEWLASQLSLTYYDRADVLRSMNSYTDSVMKDQFTIKRLDDGIRVEYQFSNYVRNQDELPEYISEERFQRLFLDQVSAEDQNLLKKRYKPYNKAEGVMKRYNIPAFEVKEFLRIIDQIGYGKEELEVDQAEQAELLGRTGPIDFGIEVVTEDFQFAVTIPVEYRLDGPDFVASVPVGDIADNRRYPLHSIRLLEFFGAAYKDIDGYSLVPDGSGALIRFNNGKTGSLPYREYVYGDEIREQIQSYRKQSEIAYLPVFGMKHEDKAFLAIIEEGDAIARITADVSGKSHSFNTASSEVTVNQTGTAQIGSGAKAAQKTVFQNEMYAGRFTVRYGLLHGEQADYSGMAAYYRNYLIERKGIKPLSAGADIPLYLETVGAIERTKSMLGIPVKTIEPLTTFEESGVIVEELANNGIGDIRLRLSGWFNGGLSHSIPDHIDVESKLGGKRGLQELREKLPALGAELYPDASFSTVYRSGDGFNPKNDGAKFPSQTVAAQHVYNPVSSEINFGKPVKYYLAPDRLYSVFSGYMKQSEKLGLDALSIRDLGSTLQGDYDERDLIDREEAKRLVTKQLDEARASLFGVMLDGANAYSLPYATDLVNVPVESSLYAIVDEDVPFLQMALHGLIPYAAESYNHYKDPDTYVLKLIETGSYPSVQWSYSPSSRTTDTRYDYMYALHYGDWLPDTVSIYQELNAALRDVQDQPIRKHQYLSERLVEVKYANGKTFWINYDRKDASYGGRTIPALSYVVGKEG